jgi:hypothetical protein
MNLYIHTVVKNSDNFHTFFILAVEDGALRDICGIPYSYHHMSDQYVVSPPGDENSRPALRNSHSSAHGPTYLPYIEQWT